MTLNCALNCTETGPGHDRKLRSSSEQDDKLQRKTRPWHDVKLRSKLHCGLSQARQKNCTEKRTGNLMLSGIRNNVEANQRRRDREMIPDQSIRSHIRTTSQVKLRMNLNQSKKLKSPKPSDDNKRRTAEQRNRTR